MEKIEEATDVYFNDDQSKIIGDIFQWKGYFPKKKKSRGNHDDILLTLLQYNLPKVIGFMEAGRIGKGGTPTTILLLFGQWDIYTKEVAKEYC